MENTADKTPEPERKIIKFDTPDVKKPENSAAATNTVGQKTPSVSTDAAREELEQRRTMLQNMKDFDFQIKKNQEEITIINEKVEGLSKDLDDLVSLYEIVSEQMNPFVGLSKVTKKRLDAMENFTQEMETLKTRIGELESITEKNGVNRAGFTPEAAQPITEQKAQPKATSPVPTKPSVAPLSTPVVPQGASSNLQVTVKQTLSEQEMDELLSRSLESLFIEQNIDNMINEYFLSLK